jgi:hypothetical protein
LLEAVAAGLPDQPRYRRLYSAMWHCEINHFGWMVWLQQIQRGSNFRCVNVSFLAFQNSGFENGEGL